MTLCATRRDKFIRDTLLYSSVVTLLHTRYTALVSLPRTSFRSNKYNCTATRIVTYITKYSHHETKPKGGCKAGTTFYPTIFVCATCINTNRYPNQENCALPRDFRDSAISRVQPFTWFLRRPEHDILFHSISSNSTM